MCLIGTWRAVGKNGMNFHTSFIKKCSDPRNTLFPSNVNRWVILLHSLEEGRYELLAQVAWGLPAELGARGDTFWTLPEIQDLPCRGWRFGSKNQWHCVGVNGMSSDTEACKNWRNRHYGYTINQVLTIIKHLLKESSLRSLSFDV